jgi:purine-cytosine permease-like protein
VDDTELLRSLEGASTLEAMQRLEDELRRRATSTGPAPVVETPPFFEGEPPVSPPPPGPDGEPAPEPWESAPPPDYRPPPLVEPGPETGPSARLLPPPTELPDIAQRAELPPPPGYEPDGTERTADTAPTPVVAAAPSEPEPSVVEPEPPADDWSAFAPPVAASVVPTSEAAAPPPVAPPPAVPVAPAPPSASVLDSAPEPGPERPARVPDPLPAETAGAEPTPREQRAGRAARLFWLWFAVNSSALSMALGGVLLGMGMSLRQAIVATLAGIALSFIPLGFGTLAGKRTGQPTMIVSRASFGLTGNALPAAIAVLARVFWGGVLLWMLADAVARVLVGAHLDAGLGETVWALIGLVVGFVLASTVAVVGYGLLARVQLVLSIVAAVLVVGTAALTLPHIHLGTALTRQDGSWLLVVGGAVVVFSFIGLAWAHAGSDLARYQRPGASGGSMLWATFGATLPPFLLIAWGALLAASDPGLADRFAAQPLAAIASLLPSWYPAPLLVAAAVGLLSGSVLTLYSGGFAVQALVPRVPRLRGVLIAALLVLVVGVVLVLLALDTRDVVRDLAVTLAVPVAAWAGVFAAEQMIRGRLHPPSLLAPGGAYPAVRWINLVGLVVVSALGYGFVSSGVGWLGWEGYGLRLLGVGAGDPVAAAQLGVLGALVLGILLPIVTAIPAIRREDAVAGVAPARS